MADYVCKFVTDTGDFFAMYNTVIDQFTTPAVSSTDERIGFPEDEEVNDRHVFDLRSENLEHIEALLMKLEAGKSVTIPEARVLAMFADFLRGTVADQQYMYEETSESVMEGWATELGLRKRFPSYPADEIVSDLGTYPAFHKKAINSRSPRQYRLNDGKRASPNQNRIAARYLRTLAKIANALGPERSAPNEIVDRFYEMSQTRAQGT